MGSGFINTLGETQQRKVSVIANKVKRSQGRTDSPRIANAIEILPLYYLEWSVDDFGSRRGRDSNKSSRTKDQEAGDVQDDAAITEGEAIKPEEVNEF